MFIGRREDGTIYGAWRCRQWEGQEWLPGDSPELVAFLNPPPDPRLVLDQNERLAAKGDAKILALVNATPAQLVTYTRNNFPSLTLTEQNEMAAILYALAVAVRPQVR